MPRQTLLMAGTLVMPAGTISAPGTARAADESIALFLPEGWHTASSKPDQYDMGAQTLDGAFVVRFASQHRPLRRSPLAQD
jgi:hypothetical protein